LKIIRLSLCVFLFLSCQDEKDLTIFLRKAEIPISSAIEINTIHTDSGMISSILNSPKMLNFSNAAFPYFEFPQDLEVILFDENNNKFFSRFLINYGQELVLLASIIILFVVVSQVNHRFLGGNNLNTIFAGNAYIGVAAIGMSILIITGNIDVSVGALIGVLATICGTLAVSGYPIWFAWTAPILVGIAVNSLVGIIVAYAGIPSIVVTLGMMSILRGGLISVTGGDWITDMPEGFFLAQQDFYKI